MDKYIASIIALIMFMSALICTGLMVWTIEYNNIPVFNIGVLMCFIPIIAMYIGTVYLVIIAYIRE